MKAFRTDDFTRFAIVPVGALPHGLWPSGDGSRIYVGLANADAVAAIDTASNRVIATITAIRSERCSSSSITPPGIHVGIA